MRKIGKKGLSEMVGYVILIIIAISLSILVYAWIKKQIDTGQETCPDRISLTVEDYSCPGDNSISITFQNKGTFDINGVLVKGKNSNKILPLKEAGSSDETGISRFITTTPVTTALKSGESSVLKSFSYTGLSELKTLVIQPFVYKNKKIILCENAVQEIDVENCN